MENIKDKTVEDNSKIWEISQKIVAFLINDEAIDYETLLPFTKEEIDNIILYSRKEENRKKLVQIKKRLQEIDNIDQKKAWSNVLNSIKVK